MMSHAKHHVEVPKNNFRASQIAEFIVFQDHVTTTKDGRPTDIKKLRLPVAGHSAYVEEADRNFERAAWRSLDGFHFRMRAYPLDL